MISRILIAALATGATGFTTPSSLHLQASVSNSPTCLFSTDNKHDITEQVGTFDPLNFATDLQDEPSSSSHSAFTAIAAAAATIASSPLAANAAGPDWGLFEGRTASLLHPIAMFSMAGLMASTALLGFQWRRQRTMGDEISDLKKSLPALGGAASVTLALAEAEGAETVDSGYVAKLKAALPVQSQIDELVKERKDLASKAPKDKHFSNGSLLLFVGIAFAIEGPLNTYARAGKLFPGPHLYAACGLVTLWALAASMVPHMQKGNDTARSVHIGANVIGMGLFAWQITSGVPILLKVLEFTKWP